MASFPPPEGGEARRRSRPLRVKPRESAGPRERQNWATPCPSGVDAPASPASPPSPEGIAG